MQLGLMIDARTSNKFRDENGDLILGEHETTLISNPHGAHGWEPVPADLSGDTEVIYKIILALQLPKRTKLQRKVLKKNCIFGDAERCEDFGRQDLGVFSCEHIHEWTEKDIALCITVIICEHPNHPLLKHGFWGAPMKPKCPLYYFIKFIQEHQVNFLYAH